MVLKDSNNSPTSKLASQALWRCSILPSWKAEFDSLVVLMTNLEMIEVYKKFCKENGFTSTGIIPRVNSEEDTLLDILNSIQGQSFREGREYGFNEGYDYKPTEDGKE